MIKKLFCVLVILLVSSEFLFGAIMEEYRKARSFRDKAGANNASAARELIPYLGDKKPIYRDGAYEALLKNITDETALKVMAGALLKHKNTMVREQLAELIGELGKSQKDLMEKVLIKVLTRDPSPAVRVEAARALGKLRCDKAVKYLERTFKRSSRNWLLRGEALGALVAIQGKDAMAMIKKGLKDRDPIIKGFSIKLLSSLAPVKALEQIIPILEKTKAKRVSMKGWQPAYRAFQAVYKASRESDVDLPSLKKAITAMINLLKGLSGRIFYNDIQSLEKITGESGIIPTYRDWNGWWSVNKSRFKPPSDSDSTGNPLRKRAGTVLRYHGIPIYSTRIVFMVDHSGSMRNRLGEGDNQGKIKFDLCKSELIKTIKSLKKKMFFNVFFLESDIHVWKKRLSRALPFNQRAAIKYVSSISATKPIVSKYRMRGNFYDGFYKALQDPYADTIFILSDGGPTAGRFAFPSRVKLKFTQLNKFKCFEVHSLLIGASSSSAQRFMEELAKANGGKSHIKGGKKYDSKKRRGKGKKKKKYKKKKYKRKN